MPFESRAPAVRCTRLCSFACMKYTGMEGFGLRAFLSGSSIRPRRQRMHADMVGHSKNLCEGYALSRPGVGRTVGF